MIAEDRRDQSSSLRSWRLTRLVWAVPAGRVSRKALPFSRSSSLPRVLVGASTTRLRPGVLRPGKAAPRPSETELSESPNV